MRLRAAADVSLLALVTLAVSPTYVPTYPGNSKASFWAFSLDEMVELGRTWSNTYMAMEELFFSLFLFLFFFQKTGLNASFVGHFY